VGACSQLLTRAITHPPLVAETLFTVCVIHTPSHSPGHVRNRQRVGKRAVPLVLGSSSTHCVRPEGNTQKLTIAHEAHMELALRSARCHTRPTCICDVCSVTSGQAQSTTLCTCMLRSSRHHALAGAEATMHPVSCAEGAEGTMHPVDCVAADPLYLPLIQPCRGHHMHPVSREAANGLHLPQRLLKACKAHALQPRLPLHAWHRQHRHTQHCRPQAAALSPCMP